MKSISKIASACLLFMMLVSVMKNAVLYTIYQYDTDVFIAMFCENKYRPQMKCDGKCKLAKMQKEQNEKEAADTLKQMQTETVFNTPVHPFAIGNHALSSSKIVKQAGYCNQLYSFLYTAKLLKPPAGTLFG